MRTTIDLPEATLRELKAHAALQGVPMKDVVLDFVHRGLAQRTTAPRQQVRSALPTLVPDRPLALRRPTNAALQAILDGTETQRARGTVRGR